MAIEMTDEQIEQFETMPIEVLDEVIGILNEAGDIEALEAKYGMTENFNRDDGSGITENIVLDAKLSDVVIRIWTAVAPNDEDYSTSAKISIRYAIDDETNESTTMTAFGDGCSLYRTIEDKQNGLYRSLVARLKQISASRHDDENENEKGKQKDE